MPDFSLTALVQFVGYPGLFTAVFLESGVFFGFFLPGSSMLFTAGLLASQGIFNIWILVPLLTVAAIMGDSVGYLFGAKVGIKLFERTDSRFFHKKNLEQAKIFYEKHGVLAIVLARFVPIVRTFTPIVAGIVRMRYRTFIVYNITGAVLWGSGVTFLGYILGEKAPGIEDYITPIILLIVIASCIPIVLAFFRQKKAAASSSV